MQEASELQETRSMIEFLEDENRSLRERSTKAEGNTNHITDHQESMTVQSWSNSIFC